MVFRVLTFAGSLGLVFKQVLRDPANVSARKNMVDHYSCINLLYIYSL